MTDKLKHNQSAERAKIALQKDFNKVFWDINIDSLDFKKHWKLIITQGINYGSIEFIQYLFALYTKESIREVLKDPIKGVWFPKTYKAFCTLLDVDEEEKALNILHISKTTKKKLNQLFME